MQEDKSFDLKILENRSLFRKIDEQKDLFIQMLSELGNSFPVQELASIHPNAKGSSISKGNQLESCPYQVLDLIRDFDKDKGFNIRLLCWWGHHMVLLVLYGPQTAIKFEKTIQQLKNDFTVSKTKSPWNYKNIIISSSENNDLDLEQHLREFRHLQLFKSLKFSENYSETVALLQKEITFLLHIHTQNFPY